jgi:hypothetical protein
MSSVDMPNARCPRQLLFTFCTVLPNAIVPCCVNDGKNDYCIRSNDEENAIWEPSNENTADRWYSANTRKRFGIL